MSQSSVCVISTRPPYKGQSAREALDFAMVSAAYDIPTSLILMGAGIYQLLDNHPSNLPRKSLATLFKSLELYGIDTIYVDAQSLEERHVNPHQLLPLYTLLPADRITNFLAQYDTILNF